MRPHPLVLLLLLVACAGGLAFWAAGGGAQPEPMRTADAADEARGDDADAPAAAVEAAFHDPADADADAEAAADERLPDDADERTAVDVPTGPLPTGPRIRVVRGDPPTAVPGAVVAWIPRDEALRRLPEHDRGDVDGPAWLDLPHRLGRTTIADAAGVAELPPLDDAVLVACADAERAEFAAAQLGPRTREHVLHLQADETVTVLVHAAAPAGAPDAAPGTASGVAVELCQLAKGRGSRSIYAGRTGADGTLVAHHFQVFRERPREGERFVAALALPLPSPVFAEFVGRPAQTAAVELVLPPTRALTARLRHAGGQPVLAPAMLQFRTTRPPGAAGGGQLPGDVDAPVRHKPAGDVPVALPHVGLGATITPQLRLPRERRPVAFPAATIAAAPPGEPGPVVLDLVLPPPIVVLAGTLRDATGGAFAHAEPRWTLTSTGADGAPRHLQGGATAVADGRFDVMLARPPEGPCTLRLLLASRDDGPPVGALLELPPLQEGERRDLGTLVLAPLPALVSGTVRDDRGEPIAGAALHLDQFVTTAKGGAWHRMPMLQARSGADGAFAVHGSPTGVPFRVRAEAGNHESAVSGLVTAGARVDLLLQRLGVLRGRVLLPGFVARGAAEVRLDRAGDAAAAARGERNRAEHRQPVQRRGAFTIGGIVPGPYELTVHLRNLPDPLFTTTVRVDPGDGRDAPPCTIDLRDRLFRYRLRAVDGSGRQLTALDGPILWRGKAPDGSPRDVAFRWQDGKAELITAQPFVDLVMVGRGLPPTTVSLPPGDHDVYLAMAQPVVVELPGVRALVGAQRAVRVSMICTEATGLPEGISGIDQRTAKSFSFPRWFLGKSGGGWLDGFDRAECALARNGNYEVVLRVNETAAQNSPQVSLPIGTAAVRIDGPAPQELRLQVDLARLAELVAQHDAQAAERARQRERNRSNLPDLRRR